MTYPMGIDISRYQYSSDGSQKPDFDKLNAACDFVAVRAGISWGYADPWFSYSWAHITKPRLAYHVVYPGEDAERQMRHFLDIVKPTEHDRLVLDMELDRGYSKSRITDDLLECLDYLHEHTGRYPIVYSRASWVNQFIDVSRLPQLDWWLAHYLKPRPAPLYTPEKDPPPALPKGVSNWLIHQTAERGNGGAVGVVSHYVDIDRWNGTKEQMLAYFGLEEEEPPEPPNPTQFQARVYSWATPYVNIRKEPDIRSQDLGDLYPGMVVPVYEIVGDWYRTDKGFVMSKYLERLDYEPPAVLIDIPPLGQKDPRWKNDKLGNSYLTIGNDGCLVTCFAMAIGVTPAEFNSRMRKVGGFTGAKIYWKMVEVAYPAIKYVRAIDCWDVPAPLNEIDRLLEQRIPVMVQVDYNPKTYNIDQHWVLIIGKNGNDYIINDPIDGIRGSFRDKYGDPARWIFRIRAYKMG